MHLVHGSRRFPFVGLVRLGILLSSLLRRKKLVLQTRSLELSLGDLQLGLQLLNTDRHVGIVDLFNDGGGQTSGGRRHGEGRRGLCLERHGASIVEVSFEVLVIGVDPPAGATNGATSVGRGSALGRVAAFAVAVLVLFDTLEATLLGTAETAI
jgi:hypothetical protein